MNQGTKNLLISGLISAACFAFWAWVMPTYDSVSLFREIISEREALLSSREQMVAKIENMYGQYQERSSDIKRLDLVVPKKPEIPEIISSLQDISSQTGIQLGDINIGAATNASIDNYDTVSMELGTETDYDGMINFIGSIEKNVRLTDLLSISMSPKDASKNSSLLTFQIKAVSYFLKNIEEIVKAKAQTQREIKTNITE